MTAPRHRVDRQNERHRRATLARGRGSIAAMRVAQHSIQAIESEHQANLVVHELTAQVLGCRLPGQGGPSAAVDRLGRVIGQRDARGRYRPIGGLK